MVKIIKQIGYKITSIKVINLLSYNKIDGIMEMRNNIL